MLFQPQGHRSDYICASTSCESLSTSFCAVKSQKMKEGCFLQVTCLEICAKKIAVLQKKTETYRDASQVTHEKEGNGQGEDEDVC